MLTNHSENLENASYSTDPSTFFVFSCFKKSLNNTFKIKINTFLTHIDEQTHNI